MKTVLATGVFGAITIVLLTEVMNVALAFSAMEHVATYNAWMSM